jgi:hypothetical protein
MKILIAIDGSSASKAVIEAACRLIVSPESTAVKIISVVEPFAPMITDPYAISAVYNVDLGVAISQQAKKISGKLKTI